MFPSSASGLYAGGERTGDPYPGAVLLRGPWGNDYLWARNAQEEEDYTLVSLGPDERLGTRDDIRYHSEIGFLGE